MATKRILAVEPNELVLSFLHAGLSTAGYEVDTASNGREALEKIDRRPYDLIISDVHMPELDGVGLCQALEARQSDAVHRLLLLTGSDYLDDRCALAAPPGVPTPSKPVALEDLQLVVDWMVRSGAAVEAEAVHG